MLTWIIAIVMGGIIGWLASIVMRTDAQQGIFLNIVVGCIGSILGRFLFGRAAAWRKPARWRLFRSDDLADRIPRCGRPARHRQSGAARPRSLIRSP
nr:GlsB/YeaQ/YmgE family stress response membrane protein [Sphingopyxis sp. PET50]